MAADDAIEKLQLELATDPKSPAFTRLAELYLGREMIDEAEQLVLQSLKFHPRSVSGLILLGRIFRAKKNSEAAISPLTEATQLAPDNWRAWLELAEIFLDLKKGKSSLNAFKKVLFLNPTHPTARKAVARLEVLTADEYEEDLFQMQPLEEAQMQTDPIVESTSNWTETPSGLIRIISYIDALIVRNEHQKAIELLNDCSKKFGAHPEIETRRLQLSSYEQSAFIQPKPGLTTRPPESRSRAQAIRDKKTRVLKELLRRIEPLKNQVLST